MRILGNRKIIKDLVLGEKINAFIDNKSLESLKQSYYYGDIKRGMQYRPDLVAEYYLGNAYDSWIISYINEFVNGIEDYTLGRKIKIPVFD